MIFFVQAASDIGVPVGVGGASLAGIFFYFYRQSQDRNKELTDRLLDVIVNNTKVMVELRDVINKRAFCPLQSEMNDAPAKHDR